MNIQFCSGGSRIPGWINTDLEHADPSLRVDITKPLPYANDSVDNCRIEHGAEHVTTHECLRFFDEVYRILKPGGKFRLCIPVLDRVTREHARDLVFGHGHQCAFDLELARIFLWLAGSWKCIQDVPRDEHDEHWKVIGKEKDDLETCRLEATK